MDQLTPEIMYNALVEKNISFEGIFYAAVKSTGIFCRPTCTARKPKKENVEFFTTSEEALQHGYRPCKICQPLRVTEEIPEKISELIEEVQTQPYVRIKDYDVRKRGLEPHNVRRWFQKNHGITFHAFQRMMRLNYAFNKMKNGNKITDAAFASGYDSLSGFNEAYKSLFGTSPSDNEYENTLYLTKLNTALGPMYACATEDGICLLEFTDRWMLETEFKSLSKLFKAKIILGENVHIKNLKEQLNEYFEGTRKSFDIPLSTPGTEFQQKVWQVLQHIPYGKTASYKEQALKFSNETAVRAVARANGMNRIAIVIPCHRVIGSNGDLTGYAGGIWRKKWLLEHEAKHSGGTVQGELKFEDC